MKEERQEAQQNEVVTTAQTSDTSVEVNEDGSERNKYIIIPDVYITRKVTTKGGKTYADYYVNGKLRGQDVKVRVKPGKDGEGFADVSAYTYLNLVFGEETSVSLAVTPFKRRDSATNRNVTGLSYFAYIYDEYENEPYPAPLRFETSSDKAIVMKLIEIANKKYELGLNV